MIAEARDQQEQALKRYDNLAKPLRMLMKDIPKKQRHWSYDWFLWAESIVGSRALSMMGSKHLVPFADMYNYEPQTAERAAESGRHFLKYHKIVDGFFNVYADRPCAPGVQVRERERESVCVCVCVPTDLAAPHHPPPGRSLRRTTGTTHY